MWQARLVAPAALAAGLAASVTAQQSGPAPAEGMPDGPGREVTMRACSPCHDPRRAASVRLTRDGWAAVMDAMIARGAKIADDEYPLVLDYLATHFLGEAPRPINVNTAPAIDLEAGAGLLRREAAAVIAYRQKQGPFRTLDDMKNVPGLDFSKIDRRREFLIALEVTPPAPPKPQP